MEETVEVVKHIPQGCRIAQWSRVDICPFLRLHKKSWKVLKRFRRRVYRSESLNGLSLCQFLRFGRKLGR